VNSWEPLLFTGVAFGVAVVLLPVVRYCGERFRLYDPIGRLSIHDRPITRLGGVAMMLALAASAALFAARGHPLRFTTCVGIFVLWSASVIDDFRGVSSTFRLVCQIATAALLWLGGWRLPITSSIVLNFVLMVLAVVFFINAFNMLDGADGLAAGVAGVIALGYLVANLTFGNVRGVAIAASLIGVCAAFLLFNFHPASMFMGDSGSTILGLAIAMLGIDFYGWSVNGYARWTTPLLFEGLPLLDATAAIIRRLLRGRSPFSGDRDHSYDLLLRRGWSVPEVALCSYGITGLLVLAGMSFTLR